VRGKWTGVLVLRIFWEISRNLVTGSEKLSRDSEKFLRDSQKIFQVPDTPPHLTSPCPTHPTEMLTWETLK
jgi:hypothetical protein